MSWLQDTKKTDRVEDQFRHIITLGPKGTSSEQVAHLYAKKIWKEKEVFETSIILLDSFEQVLKKLENTDFSCALIPHAYEGINKFYINSNLRCIDMFIQNTPRYGLVKKKGRQINKFCTVALNPVTTHILDDIKLDFIKANGYGIKSVPSTSIAAKLVQIEKVDLAITNEKAIENTDLEFISVYGPITMGWSIFVRNASNRENLICGS